MTYEIPVIDFLAQYTSGPDSKSVAGYKAVWARYAEHGRSAFTTELLHEVDKNDAIYEFIKGRLRVFCYFTGDGGVVLTNGTLKQGNKVDSAAVAQAIRAKNSEAAMLAKLIAAKAEATNLGRKAK
ncbi:hypothetical protein [Paraburkholderia guartelaensis]|uniref:hypothetical protein n=1 Tax=Paraburkholderia guartelaensis TaxID=2546446 RepID=UPI002AB60D26|nr:hypothetical protein [Paraburkholderia guartelaensis]